MSYDLENLTFGYDQKKVLDGFSLTLPEQGAVCLFGPSGCGKSTLLNIIAGLTKQQSGSIGQIRGKRIAYVFQDERLLPWLSAVKNVEAALEEGEKDTASAWLKKVGFPQDACGKFPDELSAGMRQRVSIARALAFGGDIYLLDEPFKGLDMSLKEEIMWSVREHTRGALVILVTHDAFEAVRMSSSIHCLGGPPLELIKTLEVPACEEGRMDIARLLSPSKG